MAKNSAIDWTDHTWNPWQGCHKVSDGCENCYMYRDKTRFGQNPMDIKRSSKETFNKPLTWRSPAMVFVCSWSDFFIEGADAWRDDAWEIIRKTPHLTYQILTKRPENIKDRLPEGWPFENVWLGVTTENQEQADKRIPILLQTPANLRFISVEPMLGPIDLKRIQWPDKWKVDVLRRGTWEDPDIKGFVNHSDMEGIDWVICGGESGPNAREMKPKWAEQLLNQCQEEGADTPFFMKQMSGKNKSERTSIPESLMVRKLPESTSRSLFYLQDSRGYVGNDMLFWALGGGYTTDVTKAEAFSMKAAFKQNTSRPTDIPWPKEYIDARTKPVIDVQLVLRKEAYRLHNINKEPAPIHEPKRETSRCCGCGIFIKEADSYDNYCKRCQARNKHQKGIESICES